MCLNGSNDALKLNNICPNCNYWNESPRLMLLFAVTCPMVDLILVNYCFSFVPAGKVMSDLEGAESQHDTMILQAPETQSA